VASWDFNPRASLEARRPYQQTIQSRPYFNPRASLEARQTYTTGAPATSDFNPRASLEVRRLQAIFKPRFLLFQSTRLA